MHQVDDDDDEEDDDEDDDICLIAKPDGTYILSQLRSRATSSRCTSCWRTPRLTMSRRTVWSTQGENDKTKTITDKHNDKDNYKNKEKDKDHVKKNSLELAR